MSTEATPAAPTTPPAPVPVPAAQPDLAQMVARETQMRKVADEAKAAVESAKAEQQKLAAARAELERQQAGDKALAEAATLLRSGKKLDAMKALGLTYDEITNERLNLMQADASPATKADLAAIRAEFDRQMNAEKQAVKDEAAKAQQALQAQQIDAAKSNAKTWLEEHADEYPLTAEMDGGSVLFAVIEKDFEDRAERNEDGTVRRYPDKPLTFAEAAKKREDERLAQFSKVESRKAKKPAPSVQDPKAPDKQADNQIPPATAAAAAAQAVTAPGTTPVAPKPAPGITSELAPTTAAAAPIYRTEQERIDAAIKAGERARDARRKT